MQGARALMMLGMQATHDFAAEAIEANKLAHAAQAAGRWDDVRKHWGRKNASLSEVIVLGDVTPSDISEHQLRDGYSLIIKVRDASGREASCHTFYSKLSRNAQVRVDYLLYAARTMSCEQPRRAFAM